MKRWMIALLLCLVVAAAATAGLTTIGGSAPPRTSAKTLALASPADSYVSQGKYYLQMHNILSARSQFQQAVQADPNNQEANLLYGITRVFAIYENSQAPTSGLDSVREIFELSGFSFQTFGLYNTTGTPPQNLASTTPRSGAILDFLKTQVLPEVDAAIANLSVVTDPSFSSVIAPATINGTGLNLNVDYADALVVKSLLYALKCNLNLMLVYNMDVYLPDIQSAPEELMTYKALFQDANFLTVKDASRLATARTALVNFIDTYTAAAPVLLGRTGIGNHLFIVDAAATNEPFDLSSTSVTDVKNTLAELKAAISGPHTFATGSNSSLTVDLSRFLNDAAPINLRAKLGDCSTGGAFPDPTFGGVLPQSFPQYNQMVSEAGPHMLGITCTGRETPKIEVNDYVSVFSTAYYSSGPQSVTIHNRGTAPLNVSQIALGGTNAGDFTIGVGTCGSTTPSLFPGQSCDMIIDLKTPLTHYYNLYASLNIASNDVTKTTTSPSIYGYVDPPPGGNITGTVKDAATGAGLQGVQVEVYYPNGSWSRSAWTDSFGDYSISGLESGNYKFRFNYSQNSYVPQWYNNKTDSNSADVVALTPSAVTLATTYLARGGAISGRVTDANGNGVNGCMLDLYTSTGTYLQYAQTDFYGNYTISGVATGSYKLYFDGSNLGLSKVYYGGQRDFTSASLLSVTSPNTTSGINATLQSVGSISGRVTDPTGHGLAGIGVIAYQAGSTSVYVGTTTAGDGTYSLTALLPGQYKIQFSGTSGWAGTFYNGKQDLSSADAVTVFGGSNIANIDAVLQAAPAALGWGQITHVTRADGSQYDYLDAGVNGGVTSLSGMQLTVTGPAGFSYTYSDADKTPWLPSSLALSKPYSAGILANGVYTFTLNDGKGNLSHRVELNYAPSKGAPSVDSSTIRFQRNADGSYRFTWAPVNDTFSYYYRVRIAAADGVNTPVFLKGPESATYADIPATAFVTGQSYNVRIEAYDQPTTALAAKRSDSAYVSFNPQQSDYNPNRLLIAYAFAQNRVEATGTASVGFGFGFSSTADAQKVTAATVTGPNGFSYTFQPADLNGTDYYKNSTTFNVAPVPGIYTFNIMANGVNHVASATLTAPVPNPIPDSTTYQAEDLGNGSIRFSWANVNQIGAVYYRVQVNDTVTGLNYNSARQNQTYVDMPKSQLGDLSTKRWRVEVYDAPNVTTGRNRSNGNFTAAPFSLQAYDPSRPTISTFRLRNATEANRKYAHVSVGASTSASTLAQILVTGPNGYSRDLLAAGRYVPAFGAYVLEDAANFVFAPGLYTLKVKDSAGKTVTRYFYKPEPHPIAPVDYHSYFVDREPSGSLRLSWAPVPHDVPLWYEVSLYETSDLNGDRLIDRKSIVSQNYGSVTNATIFPLTSVSIPPSALSASNYLVIRAYDGTNFSTIDNVSSSVMVGISGNSAGANYAALTDLDKDGYASDIDSNDYDAASHPFATGNTSLAIAVTSTSPANNATGVVENTPLAVTFNKVIDQRTLPGSITLNNGASGTVAYNPSTMTATFIPQSPLVSGTRYTATIATGLRDEAGNALSSPYSWSFTTQGAAPQYNLGTTITGSGSVNSVSGVSFACASGNCSAPYNFGSHFLLHASPSSGYSFAGWTGACAAYGIDDCPIDLLGNVATGATFTPATSIRIGGVFYPHFQEAFTVAATGAVVQSKALSFIDNDLLFDRPGIAVKVKGGYDSSFATNSDYTVLDGRLSVRSGTLRVERVKIR